MLQIDAICQPVKGRAADLYGCVACGDGEVELQLVKAIATIEPFSAGTTARVAHLGLVIWKTDDPGAPFTSAYVHFAFVSDARNALIRSIDVCVLDSCA